MINLVFATNNQHKLNEVKSAAQSIFGIKGLQEINFAGEIPETQSTLEGNALQKAHYIFDKYGMNCFADDTGLEVNVLDQGPGVYSARYAGEKCSFEDNTKKLLQEMLGLADRKARFRTVFALIINGETYIFEGVVNGEITIEPLGDRGFGYDPVFRPEGFVKTFAQMTLDEKNQISHRAIALKKLMAFLNTLNM